VADQAEVAPQWRKKLAVIRARRVITSTLLARVSPVLEFFPAGKPTYVRFPPNADIHATGFEE
jgi:hypothetical protein